MAYVSVSTKTGDKGETSLASGERVSKTSLVFDVIGTLDELNSWLGLVVVKLDHSFAEHREYVLEVQDTLFYIGAELADSPKAKLTQAHLNKLEKKSDQLQQSMKDGWTTKFLLPGGTEIGAHLDIARTVCRRCERLLHQLSEDKKVSTAVKKYLNRLSDYLYVLRCFVNHALEYREKQFESSYREKVIKASGKK